MAESYVKTFHMEILTTVLAKTCPICQEAKSAGLNRNEEPKFPASVEFLDFFNVLLVELCYPWYNLAVPKHSSNYK